jgi:hypothetical protein
VAPTSVSRTLLASDPFNAITQGARHEALIAGNTPASQTPGASAPPRPRNVGRALAMFGERS